MKTYLCSFYYECACDLDRFFELLEKNKIYCKQRKISSDGKVSCTLETKQEIKSTIKYLGMIDSDDLHEIFNTFEYHGEPTIVKNKPKLILIKS